MRPSGPALRPSGPGRAAVLWFCLVTTLSKPRPLHRSLPLCPLLGLLSALGALGCGGNPLPKGLGSEPEAQAPGSADATAAAPKNEPGELITPPFAVRDELQGLLLVWFDDKGLHTAKTRAEIPEARRKQVRVDSLTVAPDKRLDPDHVYVADVSAPAASGGYAVHKHTRAWFEAQADAQTPKLATTDGSGATLYMASWCGACKAAAKFLHSRNIPVVEKDIEKDAAANAEMLRKAQAAGKTPRGVPVIDFRGHIILSFDQAALEQLIEQQPQKPI